MVGAGHSLSDTVSLPDTGKCGEAINPAAPKSRTQLVFSGEGSVLLSGGGASLPSQPGGKAAKHTGLISPCP